ncbi:hypothetical protein LV89_04851 [Arcicella aurantiaca]|uniref:Uncharacterized protein n=1 Tax=Arcicella aurantiaca TaxID=591202 RepID=A0A316DFI7_9BACT|nr:hypothetical protein [Arcicella aurantiaca]PWK16685.1 hypothetical protein LV89_04851 [Arcicella aurantiaca]
MTIKELKELAIGNYEVSILDKEGVLKVEEHNPELYKERIFKFMRSDDSLLLKISESNQLYIQKLVCGIVLQESLFEDDVLLIKE